MIKLTRINGSVLLINESFIEAAEEAPDTVLTMQNGHKYLVKETVDEIVDLSEQYRRKCYPTIAGQD
ncbi:MAG: flagellar FlbD family protein [Oscillospiraceae bacterium]|nr:flagellar FlbD family protein [Oscillospiraceae bacterium]